MTPLIEGWEISRGGHSHAEKYGYDGLGNITAKTSAGQLVYDADTNQLESRITPDGVLIDDYRYDANGNMESGDGRTYQWASFNKPHGVSSGDAHSAFSYDGSQRRIKQVTNEETTYYLAPGYERVIKPGGVVHRHHVVVGNDVVATYERSEKTTSQADHTTVNIDTGEGALVTEAQVNSLVAASNQDRIFYYHRDHLGSGELITNAEGEVIRQRIYSPFGEDVSEIFDLNSDAALYGDQDAAGINPETGADQAVENAGKQLDQAMLADSIGIFAAQSAEGLRGFTSHETMDKLGLVHMNARLYDPVTARFVSADSIIPDMQNPLAYNRYAYVYNNPMRYRDPSGHFAISAGTMWLLGSGAAFVGAHLSDDQQLQMISTVVLSTVLMHPGGVFGSAFGAGAGAIGPNSMTAFSASLTVSTLRTGPSGENVRDAMVAGLSAAAASFIGHGAKGSAGIGEPMSVERFVSHGISQGVMSELRGDSFGDGFLAGVVGHAAGGLSASVGGDLNEMHRAIVAGFIGGVAAEATGGDFANSAIQSATVYLYNSALGVDAQKRIDLLDHEGVNGSHTIEKHVGKSDNYLRRRMNKASVSLRIAPGVSVDRFPSTMSTFESLEAANALVNMTLAGNHHEIQTWLDSGGSNTLTVGATFNGSSTGRVAYREGRASLNTGPTRVRFGGGNAVTAVLRRNDSFANGYNVHTAYPRR